MESIHLALENVINTVFDGSNEYSKHSTEVQLSLHRILEGLMTTTSIYMKLVFFIYLPLIWLFSPEGLLQQLISLNWTEPTMVETLGHYLEALGPFLRYYPDAVGSVVNKLFELLRSLPFMVKVVLFSSLSVLYGSQFLALA